MMKSGVLVRVAVLAAGAAGALLGGALPARAQMTNVPVGESGWSFNVTPYLWLPKIDATVNFSLPNAAGRVGVDTSPSSYLGGLNFAMMGAAEARYDRFSVMTDLMYVNMSFAATRFRPGNAALLPGNPVTATADLNLSTRLSTGVWGVGFGYTVLNGGWGNVDVLAGFRLAFMDAKANYARAISFSGPNGNTATAFGATGGLTASENLWNGIAGVRARINIGSSNFFVPLYADVGGGSSSPTWQVAGGVGYKTAWSDLSLGWRYLSFTQTDSHVVKTLALNGPYLAATFRF